MSPAAWSEVPRGTDAAGIFDGDEPSVDLDLGVHLAFDVQDVPFRLIELPCAVALAHAAQILAGYARGGQRIRMSTVIVPACAKFESSSRATPVDDAKNLLDRLLDARGPGGNARGGINFMLATRFTIPNASAVIDRLFGNAQVEISGSEVKLNFLRGFIILVATALLYRAGYYVSRQATGNGRFGQPTRNKAANGVPDVLNEALVNVVVGVGFLLQGWASEGGASSARRSVSKTDDTDDDGNDGDGDGAGKTRKGKANTADRKLRAMANSCVAAATEAVYASINEVTKVLPGDKTIAQEHMSNVYARFFVGTNESDESDDAYRARMTGLLESLGWAVKNAGERSRGGSDAELRDVSSLFTSVLAHGRKSVGNAFASVGRDVDEFAKLVERGRKLAQPKANGEKNLWRADTIFNVSENAHEVVFPALNGVLESEAYLIEAAKEAVAAFHETSPNVLELVGLATKTVGADSETHDANAPCGASPIELAALRRKMQSGGLDTPGEVASYLGGREGELMNACADVTAILSVLGVLDDSDPFSILVDRAQRRNNHGDLPAADHAALRGELAGKVTRLWQLRSEFLMLTATRMLRSVLQKVPHLLTPDVVARAKRTKVPNQEDQLSPMANVALTFLNAFSIEEKKNLGKMVAAEGPLPDVLQNLPHLLWRKLGGREQSLYHQLVMWNSMFTLMQTNLIAYDFVSPYASPEDTWTSVVINLLPGRNGGEGKSRALRHVVETCHILAAPTEVGLQAAATDAASWAVKAKMPVTMNPTNVEESDGAGSTFSFLLAKSTDRSSMREAKDGMVRTKSLGSGAIHRLKMQPTPDGVGHQVEVQFNRGPHQRNAATNTFLGGKDGPLSAVQDPAFLQRLNIMPVVRRYTVLDGSFNDPPATASVDDCRKYLLERRATIGMLSLCNGSRSITEVAERAAWYVEAASDYPLVATHLMLGEGSRAVQTEHLSGIARIYEELATLLMLTKPDGASWSEILEHIKLYAPLAAWLPTTPHVQVTNFAMPFDFAATLVTGGGDYPAARKYIKGSTTSRWAGVKSAVAAAVTAAFKRSAAAATHYYAPFRDGPARDLIMSAGTLECLRTLAGLMEAHVFVSATKPVKLALEKAVDAFMEMLGAGGGGAAQSLREDLLGGGGGKSLHEFVEAHWDSIDEGAREKLCCSVRDAMGNVKHAMWVMTLCAQSAGRSVPADLGILAGKDAEKAKRVLLSYAEFASRAHANSAYVLRRKSPDAMQRRLTSQLSKAKPLGPHFLAVFSGTPLNRDDPNEYGGFRTRRDETPGRGADLRSACAVMAVSAEDHAETGAPQDPFAVSPIHMTVDSYSDVHQTDTMSGSSVAYQYSTVIVQTENFVCPLRMGPDDELVYDAATCNAYIIIGMCVLKEWLDEPVRGFDKNELRRRVADLVRLFNIPKAASIEFTAYVAEMSDRLAGDELTKALVAKLFEVGNQRVGTPLCNLLWALSQVNQELFRILVDSMRDLPPGAQPPLAMSLTQLPALFHWLESITANDGPSWRSRDRLVTFARGAGPTTSLPFSVDAGSPLWIPPGTLAVHTLALLQPPDAASLLIHHSVYAFRNKPTELENFASSTRKGLMTGAGFLAPAANVGATAFSLTDLDAVAPGRRPLGAPRNRPANSLCGPGEGTNKPVSAATAQASPATSSTSQGKVLVPAEPRQGGNHADCWKLRPPVPDPEGSKQPAYVKILLETSERNEAPSFIAGLLRDVLGPDVGRDSFYWRVGTGASMPAFMIGIHDALKRNAHGASAEEQAAIDRAFAVADAAHNELVDKKLCPGACEAVWGRLAADAKQCMEQEGKRCFRQGGPGRKVMRALLRMLRAKNHPTNAIAKFMNALDELSSDSCVGAIAKFVGRTGHHPAVPAWLLKIALAAAARDANIARQSVADAYATLYHTIKALAGGANADRHAVEVAAKSAFATLERHGPETLGAANRAYHAAKKTILDFLASPEEEPAGEESVGAAGWTAWLAGALEVIHVAAKELCMFEVGSPDLLTMTFACGIVHDLPRGSAKELVAILVKTANAPRTYTLFQAYEVLTSHVRTREDSTARSDLREFAKDGMLSPLFLEVHGLAAGNQTALASPMLPTSILAAGDSTSELDVLFAELWFARIAALTCNTAPQARDEFARLEVVRDRLEARKQGKPVSPEDAATVVHPENDLEWFAAPVLPPREDRLKRLRMATLTREVPNGTDAPLPDDAPEGWLSQVLDDQDAVGVAHYNIAAALAWLGRLEGCAAMHARGSAAHGLNIPYVDGTYPVGPSSRRTADGRGKEPLREGVQAANAAESGIQIVRAAFGAT